MGIIEEVWIPLVRHNLGGKYAISNLQRIKTIKCRNRFGWYYPKKERIRRTYKNEKGYMQVSLYNMKGQLKTFRIHRLMAESFIVNPESKPQVNHLNSKRDDNRLDNLEWVTNSENQTHSFKFGNYPDKAGEKSPASKLKEEQVKYIFYSDKPIYKLAKQFNVHYDTIECIKRGKTWTSITGVVLVPKTVAERSGENHYFTKLKNSDVIDIYKSKDPARILSEKYGIGRTTIYAIRKGQNWGHLTKSIN